MNVQNILKIALSCSVVKQSNIAKHFQLPSFEIGAEDVILQDEALTRKVLGFILSCSTAKYGISKKKGRPYGCPHLDKWQELVSGNADMQEYSDIFTFLSHCPTNKGKSKISNVQHRNTNAQLKNPSLYITKAERHTIVENEKKEAEKKRLMERWKWKQQSKKQRSLLRFSLTEKKMRNIYMQLKKEMNVSNDRLCIKSNTSRYAIEAIDNGTLLDTYTMARLTYFILTHQDIDDSEYRNEPAEVFVDYLAGWHFTVRHSLPQKHSVVENPKACNLPIYLKR